MARGYLEMMLPITLSLAPLERRNVLSSCSFVPTLLKTPGCRLLAKSTSTPMVSKLFSRSSFSKGSLSSLPHFPLQGQNETDLRKISAEYWIIQPLEPKRKLLPILQTFLDAIIREPKVFQMLCKITDSVSMQYYMNACVKEPMTILGSLNHNRPFQQKTPIPSTLLVLPHTLPHYVCWIPRHRGLSTEREAERHRCCPTLPCPLLFFSLHCACFVHLVSLLHPSLFLVSTSWFLPITWHFHYHLAFQLGRCLACPTHRQ